MRCADRATTASSELDRIRSVRGVVVPIVADVLHIG
jgi:hypothetical protein